MASLIPAGSASGTGSMTLVAPVTNSTQTITLPDATGTAVVAGANSAIVLGTAQNSTSGTSIDFTGIPSWVKRITVVFNGVSTNGVSNIQIQIGAGSVTTSGYLTGCAFITSSSSTQLQISTGIGVVVNYAAAGSQSGLSTLVNMGGNSWVCSSANGRVDAASGTATSNGSITLGGTLDRLRITTVNGTDTFDAGSINIQYE